MSMLPAGFKLDPVNWVQKLYHWWYYGYSASEGSASDHLLQHHAHYGDTHQHGHSQTARRRQNGLAIAMAVVVPLSFYVALSQLTSSMFYYRYPEAAVFLIWGAIWVELVIGACALHQYSRQIVAGKRTWPSFIFWTSAIAIVVGLLSGYANYRLNSRRYFDYMSLRRDVDVDPAKNQGQQDLDAGEIDFKAGTKIDRSMTMSYHKSRTWCVAPISSRDPECEDCEKLASYDFWAVGMDCCSGSPGHFACAPDYTQWTSTSTPKGIRVFEDSEIDGYKLAVEQATAKFNIQSRRPIFLYMTNEPYTIIRAFYDNSLKHAHIVGVAYFLFQCFLVFRQACEFGKGAKSGYPDVEKSIKHLGL